MNAIGRMWWLYAVALKSRQALLSGSLVALTVTVSTIVASGGRGPGIAFFLVMGLSLGVLCTLFSSAQMFRALSGSRPFMLAPRARARALTALLTFNIGIALVLALPLALLVPQPLRAAMDASLSGLMSLLMLIMLGMVSVLAWMLFLPPLLLMLPPVIFVPGILVLRRIRELIPDVQSDPIVVAWIVLAAGWALFSAWYLRTRRIRPMIGTRAGQRDAVAMDPFRRLPALRSHESLALHRPAARRVVWYARGPYSQLWVVAAGAVLALAFIGIPLTAVQMLAPPRAGMAWFFAAAYLAMPLLFVLMLALLSAQFVRRARLLWMRSGSRAALLREIERASWLSDGVLLCAGTTLGVIMLLRIVHDASAIVLAGLAGAVIAGGVFSVYVGMLCAGALRIADMAAVTMLAMSLVAAGWVLVIAADLWLLVPLAAAQLVCALLCRAFAARRWASMDFLRYKPWPRRTA